VDDATLVALAGLGALHGVNPAMGWLFAVALGLQERSRRALAGALLPIAAGHELSVAVTVLAIELSGAVAGQRIVGIAGALALIGFGAWKLVSGRGHPRWVGARLGRLELAWWSFLMSSAHGAGLMLFPVVGERSAAGHDPLAAGLAGVSLEALGLAAGHTAALLVVMGAVALAVYEVLGLGFLRRAWVNVDRVWAFALVSAGMVTLVT
jgi:hypothetical protein